MDLNTKLFKRVWLIKNKDWLLSEVAYYKEFKHYLKTNKVVVWRFGNEESKAKIDTL